MSRIYLSDIVEKKKSDLVHKPLDLDALKEAIKTAPVRPSFKEAMTKPGLSIIGEIKKASPSKGLIRPDFKPVELAGEYGVAVDAVSVLTEENYFLGHPDYLEAVSQAIDLPVLYKDFVVEPAQVYHARAIGASCVLLIVAILTDDELTSFLSLAESIGLDALVETHTEEEIQRAVAAGATIIGINNRDLNNFHTDIRTTLKLREFVPDDRVIISESGIFTPEDIEVLKEANIKGVLVGESFMRGDIKTMAKAFKEAFEG